MGTQVSSFSSLADFISMEWPAGFERFWEQPLNWEKVVSFWSYDPERPMLFNSGQFFIWFTLFLTFYGLVYKHRVLRISYVLLFSLFFYFKSSGLYLLILIASIVLDWLVALGIEKYRNTAWAKILLVGSVSANLFLLGYFKYSNFLMGNLMWLHGDPFHAWDIFLPIGISFYTFQTISYVVDAYRGTIKPTRSLLDYAFYMSFFPHLVAGPIVRARDFLPQVGTITYPSAKELSLGAYLVIKGLVKKAVIADHLSQYADLVFQHPAGYSGFENLMAMYAYAMQIYCDFSGYTDMALGLAAIMGYTLAENFNSPYTASNITEFWHRWHISLSTWLRDYVYIPLGGNRKGELRQSVNLLATMLLGGLWHGASWKFVVWGGMHGLALVLHKYWLRATGKVKFLQSRWLIPLGVILTFHFVAALWVYFRASDFDLANLMLNQIWYDMDVVKVAPAFLTTNPLVIVMLLLGFGLHFVPAVTKEKIKQLFISAPWLLKWLVFLFTVQLILQVQDQVPQPFIYFQF